MLGLLILALTVLDWTAAESSSILAVYEDGRVERIERAELAFEGRAEAELRHFWTWSACEPPQRRAVDEMPSWDGTGCWGPSARAERILRAGIRIPWGEEDAWDPDARLVAAPLGMWGEVPEASLPSWPIPPPVAGLSRLGIPIDPTRAWRWRIRGSTHGSWWVDTRPGMPALEIRPQEAPSHLFEVRNRQSGAIERFGASILGSRSARVDSHLLAQYAPGDGGRLELLTLPSARELTLVVSAPGYRSAVIQARPDFLPRRIFLEHGTTLVGRVVDPDGQPLEGVEVAVEAVVSGHSGTLFRRAIETNNEGRWQLEGVPEGQVAIVATLDDHVPHLATLEVMPPEIGAEVEVGTWTLEPGIELEIRVVDDEDTPVPGARLTASAGREARTDLEGRARLGPLEDARPVRMELEAPGHLDDRIEVVPSASTGSETVLVLERAFRLEGRLVDVDGSPVDLGQARVEVGNSSESHALSAEGRFELDLVPDRAVSLVLSSPATRELRLRIAGGEAGTVRDLGDLRVETGLAVRGEVWNRTLGEPVAGARAWLPRPSPRGPITTWARGDVLETRTDAAGRFELRGLGPGPARLTIEAAGLAPITRSVVLDAVEPVVDLGEIEMGIGGTVVVEAPDASDGALARVDRGGRWLEMEMSTATLMDGRAVLPNIPPGQVIVTVLEGSQLDGGRLACERSVRVEDGEEIRIDCEEGSTRITGTVRVGSRPAGPGSLTWLPEPVVEVPALILNRSTAGGLRQQRVWGAGRPPVRVAVDDSGFFTSEGLASGRWDVVWHPAEGQSTPPLEVVVPEMGPSGTGEVELELRYPVSRVRARVVDTEGQPVEGARIEDRVSGAVTVTSADGEGVLGGLEPGPHRLRARLGEKRSPTVEVELGTDSVPPVVELVLGDPADPTLRVRISDPELGPAAAAIVFLETELGSNIVTCDSLGRAGIPLETPPPKRLRIAAWHQGRWAFGDWMRWSSDPDVASDPEIGLSFAETGTLAITTRTLAGSLSITTGSGWDLARLLTVTGAHPRITPGTELRISGLPADETYTVDLSGTKATVGIEPSGITPIELDPARVRLVSLH